MLINTLISNDDNSVWLHILLCTVTELIRSLWFGLLLCVSDSLRRAMARGLTEGHASPNYSPHRPEIPFFPCFFQSDKMIKPGRLFGEGLGKG